MEGEEDAAAVPPPVRGAFADLAAHMDGENDAYAFFQLMRRVEAAIRSDRTDTDNPDAVTSALGAELRARDEPIRLRAAQGGHHPTDEVSRIKWDAKAQRLDVFVEFLGLIGPSGALPSYYSEHAMNRQRRSDHAFTEFLDLFHHRTLSFFYRAWKKYRPDTNFEATRGDGHDPMSTAIASVFGVNGEHLRDRLSLRDVSLYGYAGRLARRSNAQTLGAVLEDALQAPIAIKPFCGGWIAIADDDCSRLGVDAGDCWNRLGVNAVVGHAYWDVQRKFRILVGPVSWDTFQQLLPGATMHERASDLARFSVGPGLAFDYAITLKKGAAPPMQLGDPAFRLGWSTWLPDDGLRRRDLEAIIPSQR